MKQNFKDMKTLVPVALETYRPFFEKSKNGKEFLDNLQKELSNNNNTITKPANHD